MATPRVDPLLVLPMPEALRAEAPDVSVVAPRAASRQPLRAVGVWVPRRAVVLAEDDVYTYSYTWPSVERTPTVTELKRHFELLFGERNFVAYAPERLVLASHRAAEVSGEALLPVVLELISVCPGRALPLDKAVTSALYRYVSEFFMSSGQGERIGGLRVAGAHRLDDEESLMAVLAYSSELCVSSEGAHLYVDARYLQETDDSLLKIVQSTLVAEGLADTDPMHPEVRRCWHHQCAGRLVRNRRNGHVFRVTDVAFDRTPCSLFRKRNRQTGVDVQVSFLTYFGEETISDHRQPLLKAFNSRGQPVELVPELLVRLESDVRADLRGDALQRRLALFARTPTERCACIGQVFDDIATPPTPMPFGATLVDDGALEAFQLEDPSVCFGDRGYPVDNGSFRRWMRNGLEQPVKVSKFLFVFPESDTRLLDVWMRSLRDIAHVAFGMHITDPKRASYTDAEREVVGIMERAVTPETQAVLLLLEPPHSERVYELFKQTGFRLGVPVTQVVRSDTIRKRHSIAAILSRICLQINAKFGAALWSISLNTDLIRPLMQKPTVLVGISELRRADRTYVGLVASMDAKATQYYNDCLCLEQSSAVERLAELADGLQRFLTEAFEQFHESNAFRPEHIIVFRACQGRQDYSRIRDVELRSTKAFIDAISTGAAKGTEGQEYAPSLSLVAAHRRPEDLLFSDNKTETAKPGTLVNAGTLPPYGELFRIASVDQHGQNTPSTFCVIYDDSGAPLTSLQQLVYALMYLYPNTTECARFPDPLMRASKLADFDARVIRQRLDSHSRFSRASYYL